MRPTVAALRETDAKADGISAGPPANNQILHRTLHLKNHPRTEQCRLGAGHRGVQQKHQPSAMKQVSVASYLVMMAPSAP